MSLSAPGTNSLCRHAAIRRPGKPEGESSGAAIAPTSPPALFVSRSTLEAMRWGRNIWIASIVKLRSAASAAAASTARSAGRPGFSAIASSKPRGTYAAVLISKSPRVT
ncbi:hypothetical protein D3C83_03920 [compost metagenome]